MHGSYSLFLWYNGRRGSIGDILRCTTFSLAGYMSYTFLSGVAFLFLLLPCCQFYRMFLLVLLAVYVALLVAL